MLRRFVRHGLGQIVGLPPLPLPRMRVPLSLVRAAEIASYAQDNAQKDGLKKTEEAISRDVKDMSPKGKVHKDGLKKTEEASVATEIQSMAPDNKTKPEEESVAPKIQSMGQRKALDDNFCKSVASELQDFIDVFSKFGVEKDKTISQPEMQRTTLSELEKTVSERIQTDVEALKKMNQGDMSTSSASFTGKKEKATLSELEKTASERIADADVSLKKLKQGDDNSRNE